MIVLHTRKGREKKLQNNYLWLFSEDLGDTLADESSGIANLFSAEGVFLGKGLYQSQSHKPFRLLSTLDRPIDRAFFQERFAQAAQRRIPFFPQPVYRLVHGEADFLPGLIVDRYGDVFVLQLRHVALEPFKEAIVSALRALFPETKGVLERSDFASTPEHALHRKRGVLWGEVPEEVVICENGVQQAVPLLQGQKTGFFLDQRWNWQRAVQLVQQLGLSGQRVLDLFCYTGGFSLHLAKGVQMRCQGVDKSADAVEWANRNASANGLSSLCAFAQADAFSWEPSRKDLRFVVIDPPALVKSPRELKTAKALLANLCARVFRWMDDPGVLVLFSCAYFLGWPELEEIARRAAADTGKVLHVLDQTRQPPDHPWLLQMPETLYLRGLWLQVSENRGRQ